MRGLGRRTLNLLEDEMPENLTAEMETEHRKWARGTKVYGTAYPVVRLLLIAVSAVVSAKDNLLGSPMTALVSWVPIMALLVAIVTAIDTWMKPRDKWRGFMRDRDELADLILRARSLPADESALSDDIRRAFADLRRRHHETNVY